MPRRLLFVDDEEPIRITMAAILTQHDFDVTTAGTVAEALQKITSEKYDVLLSDLNIGNPGDGLTVVSAMRRTQPQAVTAILTGYPAFETALEAIRQQVDDYFIKPANIPSLVSALHGKLATSPAQRQLPPPQRVAMLLQQHAQRVEDLWLSTIETDSAHSRAPGGRQRRLEALRSLLEEVIRAAQTYSGEESAYRKDPSRSLAARFVAEASSPAAVLSEFCRLRRVISQVIQENLLAVNLSYVIPDLARVNESLDEHAQAALEAYPQAN